MNLTHTVCTVDDFSFVFSFHDLCALFSGLKCERIGPHGRQTRSLGPINQFITLSRCFSQQAQGTPVIFLIFVRFTLSILPIEQTALRLILIALALSAYNTPKSATSKIYRASYLQQNTVPLPGGILFKAFLVSPWASPVFILVNLQNKRMTLTECMAETI